MGGGKSVAVPTAGTPQRLKKGDPVAKRFLASGKGADVFIEPGSAERTGRPVFTTY
jgi:hypothetical protein